MHVKVHFIGMLKQHIGEGEKTYELSEGATLDELLLAVGRDYGNSLPPQIWDAEGERFHPTVQAAHKGYPGMERSERLKEGDEIYVFSRMAGG
jgi:molybdopterin converting factor small subunit